MVHMPFLFFSLVILAIVAYRRLFPFVPSPQPTVLVVHPDDVDFLLDD